MHKINAKFFNSTLLQLRARSATQRRLTEPESKRLDKLMKLHGDLVAGNHVQNRTLQNNLSQDHYNNIADNWEQEKQRRQDHFSQKPQELVEYEKKLREADFAYNKGDAYSRKGKHDLAHKFISEADRLYERAIERLGEFIQSDQSLQSWLDRDFDPTTSLSPSSLPRLKTSRSINNQSPIRNSQKNQIKVNVIEQAIFELVYEIKNEEKLD